MGSSAMTWAAYKKHRDRGEYDDYEREYDRSLSVVDKDAATQRRYQQYVQDMMASDYQDDIVRNQMMAPYLAEEERRRREEEEQRRRWQQEYLAPKTEKVQDGQSVSNFDTQAARRKAEPRIRYEQAYDTWNEQNPEYKDKSAEEKYSLFAQELDEQNKMANATQGYRDFYNRNKKDPEFQRMSDDEKRRQYMHSLDQTVADNGTLPEEQRAELSEYKYNGLSDKEKQVIDAFMRVEAEDFDDYKGGGQTQYADPTGRGAYSQNRYNEAQQAADSRKAAREKTIEDVRAELKHLGWDDQKIDTELARYKELVDWNKTQESREKYEQIANDPNLNNFEKAMVGAGYTAADWISFIPSAVDTAYGYMTDNSAYGRNTSNKHNYMRRMAEEGTSQVRNNLIGEDHPFAQTAYDIGVSWGESMSTKLLGAALGGVGEELALLPFAISATDTAYRDAVNRGFSEKQAEGYSVAVGALEALTEKLPFDMWQDLIKDKKLGRSIITTALTQMGAEAGEEAVNEIGQLMADQISVKVGNTGKTQAQLDIENLMAQGMTQEEAQAEWGKQFAKQVGMAALSGAVSAAPDVAVGMGIRSYRSKYGNNLTQAISDRYKDLNVEGDTAYENKLREDKAKYENNPTQYIADNYKVNDEDDAKIKAGLEEIAQKEREGKKLSVSDKSFITENVLANKDQFNQEFLDNLYDTGEDSVVPYKYREVKTEVTEDQARQMLAEAAASGDAKAFIEAQRKTRNSTIDDVANRAEEIIDFYSGMAQEHGITKEDIGKALIAEKQAYMAGLRGEELNKDQMTLESQEAYNEGKIENLKNRTRTTIDTQDALKTDVTTKEGNTVKLDGVFTSDGIQTSDGVVAMDNLDLDENKATNKAYHFADNYESVNVKNNFLNNIKDGQNIEKYNTEYGKVYDSAIAGLSLENVKKRAYTELDEDQIENIYETAVVERQARAAESFAEAFNGTKGTGAGKAFNESSSTDPKMLKIASMMARATKYDIHLVDEVPQNKGARGAFLKSDNAVYVRADDFMRSLGHEFSHYIETYNKGEYDSLRNAVANFAASKMGSDAFMGAVKSYGQLYKAGADQKLSTDDISGEMFNDIVPIILESKQGSKALAKYLAENYGAEEARTFGEKIKDVMDNIAGTIKKYLSNADHPTAYAKEMRKYADELGQFADQFIKALDGAIQNYNKGVQGESAEVQELNGIKYSMSDRDKNNYRAWSKEIQDYLADPNAFARSELKVMDYTPSLYQKMGLNNSMIFMEKSHFNSSTAEKKTPKDHNHNIRISEMKFVPYILEHPAMVLNSINAKTKDSIVAVSDVLDYKGDPIICALRPDDKGTIQAVPIMANKLASVYGRKNFKDFLENTYNLNGIMYVDKKQSQSLFGSYGVQFPFGPLNKISFNTILHTVDDFVNNPRNINRFSLSEDSAGRELSKEQQEYFSNTKATDAEGRIMALYHQTDADFTVFDTNKPGAGSSDYETPNGIFLKPTASDIGLKGKKQMELYARIENPITAKNRDALRKFFEDNVPGYKEKVAQVRSTDDEYQKKVDKANEEADKQYAEIFNKRKEMSQEEWAAKIENISKPTYAILDEWHDAANKRSAEAKKLVTNWISKSDYDGIILLSDAGSFGREVQTFIALKSNQVKNVDNTNPTSSDDVRFSLSDADEGIQAAFTLNSDGRLVLTNPKELATEQWDVIRREFNKLGYGLKNTKDAKEVYTGLAERGKNGYILNDDQDEALKKAFNIAEQQSNEEKAEAEARAKEDAKTAERMFGTTGRFKLAGYLDINGKLLDFSQGQGYRVQDHREISSALNLAEDAGYSDGLIQFMNEGNIRMQEYGIDIAVKPNDAQRSVLLRFFDSLDGEVSVDFSNAKGDTVGSAEYADGTKSKKILADIDRFFDKGEVPEGNAEYRFSLSEDSEGNELSIEQKEYFRNSQIRDDEGRLKVMFHGSPRDFTIFDPQQFGGENGKAEGYGIYFADTQEVTKVYGEKQLKGYLNIQKPAYSNKKTITSKDLAKLIQATAEAEAQRMVDDGDYDNIEDAVKDSWVSNYEYTYDKPMSKVYKMVADSIVSQETGDMGIIREVMGGNAVYNYKQAYEFYDILRDTLGFDGFVTNWGDASGNAQIVVAFNSNQFKNIDNLTPTDNPDIRLSLAEDSEGRKLTDDQREYFKDTRAVDAKGRLLELYHGTESQAFSVFNTPGIWVTPDKELATEYAGEWNNWRNERDDYGHIKYETNGMEPEVYGDKYLRMYKVYANVTSPVFLGELNRTLPDDYAGMEFDTLGIKTEEQFDKLYNLVQQHVGDKVWQLTETKEFIDLMKELGYDGMFASENGHRTICVFDSNQLKKVDNLTPTEDKDIRYSISENSDGEPLSEGQQRYFEHSAIVDDEGRLKIMYHGTRKGGFTIFDPAKSDDNLSLFFTDNIDVATTYSAVSDMLNPYDFTEKVETEEDAIKYLESIGYKDFEVVEVPNLPDGTETSLAEMPAEKKLYFTDMFGDRRSVPYDWVIDFAKVRIRQGRGMKGIYPVYLDIQNPLVVDALEKVDGVVDDVTLAKMGSDPFVVPGIRFTFTTQLGTNFVNVPIGKVDDFISKTFGKDAGKVKKSLSDLMSKTSVLDVTHTGEVNAKYEVPGHWNNIKFDGGRATTRYIASYAYDNGYDGVFIKNVVDNGGASVAAGSSNIAIAFSPDQVKSIKNPNPTSSKDIRYALGLEDDWVDFDEMLGITKTEEKAIDILAKGMEALKNQDVDVPKLRTLALKIRNEFGSSYNANKLAEDLRKAFAYMQTEDHVDYPTMMGILRDIARPVIEEAGEKVGEQEYKDFIDYFKGKKIKLTSTQKQDVIHHFGSYGAFRNAMMPITISDNGDTTLDQIWEEMVQASGGMLDIDANEGDMPINLLDTLQAMRPYVRNDFGGDTEDLAKDLAMRIVEEYIEGESSKQMHKELTEYRNRLKKDYQERLKNLKGRANAEVLARNKRRAEQAKERQEVRDLKVKIKQNANKLYTWAAKPTEGKSVPHNMMMPVMQFLQAIDFVDPVVTVSEDGKYHIRLFDHMDYEDGHKKFIYKDLVGDTRANVLKQFNEAIGRGEGTKEQRSWTDKMQGIRDIYNKVLNSTDFEDTSMDFLMQSLDAQGLAEEFDDLLSRHKGQADMNNLSSNELKLIDNIIKNIFHAVNQGNKAYSQPSVDIVNLAQSTIHDSEGKEVKTRNKILEGLHKMLRLDNVTPRTFFKLIGKQGHKVYDFLRNGLNQQILDIKQASEYMKGVMKGIDARKWTGNKATLHEVPLSGGTVRLTDGNIMGLYETIRRTGGRERIRGGVEMEIRQKGRLVRSKAIHLTDADIAKLEAMLTPEMIEVANKMQKYMAVDCSKQGNETSRKLYGFEKFTDPTYYPWTVDKETVPTSNTSENIPMFTGIERSGFTKQLKEGANNPLVIRDIFDVFTDHVSQMASYHGYAASVKDTLRWMNYREKQEQDGFVNWITNKKAINALSGSNQGVSYIQRLLLDINKANQSQYIGNFTDALIGNYKAAAVGANLRVVAQQPTAYFRALNMISPKYLLTVNPVTAIRNIKKSQDQSPISWWKSKGYYETNLGQPIKEIVTGIASPMEKAKDIMMAPAGWADDFTWGFLYTAVEKEQRAKYKGQNITPEEFRKAVNDRFDEMVDNTQVVDSTLHRSQYMRSNDRLNKLQTAFMAEPTKSYNMLLESFVEDRRDKSMKRTTRAAAAFLLSALATSAAAAVVDALRKSHDDDDWWEVWLNNLQENIADNINPLNLLPIVKDVSSEIYNVFSGKSSYGQKGNRFDLEAMASIVDAVSILLDMWNGEKSNKTGYGKYMALFAKPFSQISGIPLYNLSKDIVALYNAFFDNIETTLNSGSTKNNEVKKDFVKDVNREKSEDTLDEGIVDALNSGVSIYDLKGAVKSEYKNKYFDAYSEGNMEEAQAIAERAARAYARMGMSDEDIDAEINEWQEETITYSLLDKAIASGEGIEEEIKHVQEGKEDDKIVKHIMDRYSETIAYEDTHETESDWRGNVEKALQAIDPTLTFDTAHEEAMQKAAEKAEKDAQTAEKKGYKEEFFASVDAKNGSAGRKALDGLKAMGVDAKGAKSMVSTQYHDAWKNAKTQAEKDKAKNDWKSAYALVCNYYGVEHKDLDKTWSDWEKDQ